MLRTVRNAWRRRNQLTKYTGSEPPDPLSFISVHQLKLHHTFIILTQIRGLRKRPGRLAGLFNIKQAALEAIRAVVLERRQRSTLAGMVHRRARREYRWSEDRQKLLQGL